MEAARIEWEEYEFFHDNALGYFGDLLLFSATSPSMLIYLDNVLNTAANPNENYGREILELSAFGVDNGYTQTDIEELSKCFTGWTVRKVPVAQKKAFPTSARDPFITDSVSVASETPVLDLGPGWKYFKGTAEPPSDWAQPGFPAAGWLDGSTGIGYGDGDDETILDDMSGNYISVYVRGDFQLDFSGADAPVLEVDYDDGFVAYLNGFEIGRRGLNGEPPAFDTQSSSHGAAVDGGEPAIIDLNQWLGIINAPPRHQHARLPGAQHQPRQLRPHAEAARPQPHLLGRQHPRRRRRWPLDVPLQPRRPQPGGEDDLPWPPLAGRPAREPHRRTPA